MKIQLVLMCVAILAIAPSCSFTPEQKARVLKFTDDSLALAMQSGALKPGQSVLIASGVGIVTSLASPSTPAKQVSLNDLGLSAVVADGSVKQGDTVVIRKDDAVVVSPVADSTTFSLLLPPPGA